MKKLILLLLMGIMLVGCGNSVKTEDAEQSEDIKISRIEDEESEEESSKDSEELPAEGEIYSYDDMEIKIPSSWEGKYIIKDGQDGFAIFQKASYEKEEGWGFLFGFYKSGDVVDESAGATQIAYTDSCVYYIQEPTDVTFWHEDEAISAEYMQMSHEKEFMINSLSVKADNVRYDAREYVLPMSDVKEIPEYILQNMSADELWIARNEIFARHGREFTNSYLSNYFASCSWYEPAISADDFDEGVLSQAERENLDVITAQENAQAEEKQYPKSCKFDEEYSFDLDGDGGKETFYISGREIVDNYAYDVSYVEGDMVSKLCQDNVDYFSLNRDEYYVTDISPHFPGLEIAVMDYGMSDDLVTHFYTYCNEGLYYIGTVGGFPFKKYMSRDGFAWSGCVKGTTRTDLIHTCYSYANWYYNYEEKKLELQDTGMYEMVPTGAHELYRDIEVLLGQDVSADKVTLTAQQIFFLETDGEEWLKVKGKDGTTGYLHVTDGKIDGVEENPQDIISGLFFAG